MNFSTIPWILSLASIPLLFAGRVNAEPGDAAGFKEVAQPYFAQYCVKCHSAEKTKGNLRLDTITNHFADAVVMAQWKEVAEVYGDGLNKLRAQEKEMGALTDKQKKPMDAEFKARKAYEDIFGNFSD